MFLVNIANPGVLLVALYLTICLIYLGKEAKNAYVTLLPLLVFLVLLVMHGIQFSIVSRRKCTNDCKMFISRFYNDIIIIYGIFMD